MDVARVCRTSHVMDTCMAQHQRTRCGRRRWWKQGARKEGRKTWKEGTVRRAIGPMEGQAQDETEHGAGDDVLFRFAVVAEDASVETFSIEARQAVRKALETSLKLKGKANVRLAYLQSARGASAWNDATRKKNRRGWRDALEMGGVAAAAATLAWNAAASMGGRKPESAVRATATRSPTQDEDEEEDATDETGKAPVALLLGGGRLAMLRRADRDASRRAKDEKMRNRGHLSTMNGKPMTLMAMEVLLQGGQEEAQQVAQRIMEFFSPGTIHVPVGLEKRKVRGNGDGMQESVRIRLPDPNEPIGYPSNLPAAMLVGQEGNPKLFAIVLGTAAIGFLAAHLMMMRLPDPSFKRPLQTLLWASLCAVQGYELTRASRAGMLLPQDKKKKSWMHKVWGMVVTLLLFAPLYLPFVMPGIRAKQTTPPSSTAQKPVAVYMPESRNQPLMEASSATAAPPASELKPLEIHYSTLLSLIKGGAVSSVQFSKGGRLSVSLWLPSRLISSPNARFEQSPPNACMLKSIYLSPDAQTTNGGFPVWEKDARGRLKPLSVDEATLGEVSTEDGVQSIVRKWSLMRFYTVLPPAPLSQSLLGDLEAANVHVSVENTMHNGRGNRMGLGDVLQIAFYGLLLLLLVLQLREMAGGKTSSSDAVSIGNSGDSQNFAEVAGCDEAKAELQEVVDFLREPEKYEILGARAPRGVLLTGPPGTGKTLLARAVAGEAGVPFFAAAGSEFEEVFVGRGAARVRQLFKKARAAAPCIVFIDEIDAVGPRRVMSGGNERSDSQLMNQLLSEMDGFASGGKGAPPVIVIGATNRPESLDPALRRPGRFDRTVAVPPPDRRGRLEILGVHARGGGIRFAGEVELAKIATQAAGFTGASLAGLLNDAALLAAREGRTAVGNDQLEEAFERQAAGIERPSYLVNKKERTVVAFHEVGHALVRACTAKVIAELDAIAMGDVFAKSVTESEENKSPSGVSKISIIPRGDAALGYTLSLPEEDRNLLGEVDLRADIAVLLGGRAAERVTFGRLTSGASDDLQRATNIAESMIMSLGMDPSVGPRALDVAGSRYLGGGNARRNYGELVSDKADKAVDSILISAEEVAIQTLSRNKALMQDIAGRLLQEEVIGGDVLDEMLVKVEPPSLMKKFLSTGSN